MAGWGLTGDLATALSAISVKGELSAKGMQRQALTARLLHGAFGDLYKTYVEIKQMGQLVIEVFRGKNEELEEQEEDVEKVTTAWTIFTAVIKGIMTGFLFLSGIILVVGAALIGLTGSVAAATAMFPAFFAAIDNIRESFGEMIDHLKAMGAIILAQDWSPITDAAKMAIGGIILLIVGFYAATTSLIADILGSFTDLFTYLDSVGALQKLIDAAGNIMVAFILAFDYIFQILDALGINFDTVFGFIGDLIGGFVDFLIDSGIIDYFVEFIDILAILAVVFVVVFGEALLILARFVGFWLKAVWPTVKSVVALIVMVVARAIALLLGIYRIAFSVMSGIVDVFVGAWTGGWDGAKKAAVEALDELWVVVQDILGPGMTDMLVNLVGIWVSAFTIIKIFAIAIWDSLEAVFGGFIDGIMAVLTFFSDFFTALFTGDFQGMKDACLNLVSSLADIWGGLKDKLTGIWGDAFDGMRNAAYDMIENIKGYFEAFFDMVFGPLGDIKDALGGMMDTIGGGISGFGKSALGAIGLHSGGIATGPTSGYPAELHGTEAVVPLPDGASIPVSLEGFEMPREDDSDHNIDVDVLLPDTIPVHLQGLEQISVQMESLINSVETIPASLEGLENIAPEVRSLIDSVDTIPVHLQDLENLTPEMRSLKDSVDTIPVHLQSLENLVSPHPVPVNITMDMGPLEGIDTSMGDVVAALEGLEGVGEGGDNITLSVNVSGAGNAQDIARAVSAEVQRVFRTRSRGSGYGRGVV